MRKVAGALASFLLMSIGSSSVYGQSNYSDLWWTPTESGWGLSLSHHNDQMFGVLYIYDLDGSPTWFTIPGGTFSSDQKSFRGDIYRTTGPRPDQTFDISRVQSTKVGSASIVFGDANNAILDYTLNDVVLRKAITRQLFGDWPSSYPLDETDLWWNVRESGWGLGITRQGNKGFATLFIHDVNGKPIWLVGPDCTIRFFGFSDVRRNYSCKMYATRGTSYSAPWRSSDLTVASWGDLRFDHGINTVKIEVSVFGRFQDGTYVVWSKPVERMSFGSPKTYPNKVVAVTPGASASNVLATTVVIAEYGRPLQEPVFRAAQPQGKGIFVFDGVVAIAGRIEYQAGGGFTADDVYRSIRFSPSSDLQPNRSYKVVVRGQTSADGSAVQDIEWQFRTAPLPSIQDSPFIAFSFGNDYFAVEGINTPTPIIRRQSAGPNYGLPIVRVMTSDSRIVNGNEIWVSAHAGVRDIVASKSYRFAVLNRENLRISRLVSSREQSNDEFGWSYACTPDFVRCLFSANKLQGGSIVASYIEVVSTATGTVERTITRRRSDGQCPAITGMAASNDQIYAAFYCGSGESMELVLFDVGTGTAKSSLRIPGEQAWGMALDSSRQRAWVVAYGGADNGIRAVDTANMRVLAKAPGGVGSPGYGVSWIPGGNRILAFQPDVGTIAMLEGDTLAAMAKLVLPRGGGYEDAAGFAMCAESSGNRAWLLVYWYRPARDTAEVWEVLIKDSELAFGRKLNFESSFTRDDPSQPIEQIKCLN